MTNEQINQAKQMIESGMTMKFVSDFFNKYPQQLKRILNETTTKEIYGNPGDGRSCYLKR